MNIQKNFKDLSGHKGSFRKLNLWRMTIQHFF